MAAKSRKTAPAPTNVFTAESRTGMEFSYETVEAPVQDRPSREAKPNPHAAGVAKAVEFYREDETSGTDKPRALTVKVPTSEVKQHTNWLRKAGADNDVTVLIYPKEDGDTTALTFRAVKRITRNRSKTEQTIVEGGEAAPASQTGF